MHYPLAIDLKDKKCIVIGGGPVAQRKAETLVDFEAAVTVISPDATPGLSRMADEDLIDHLPRDYQEGDLVGAFLVIAATNDRDTNVAASVEAKAAGILVNVVDSPDECTFFVPAVIRRGDLVVAVSTGGKSPAMAKRVRQDLEAAIGPEYSDYLSLMENLRSMVRASEHSTAEARAVYDRFLNSDILDLLRAGQRDVAEQRLQACM